MRRLVVVTLVAGLSLALVALGATGKAQAAVSPALPVAPSATYANSGLNYSDFLAQQYSGPAGLQTPQTAYWSAEQMQNEAWQKANPGWVSESDPSLGNWTGTTGYSADQYVAAIDDGYQPGDYSGITSGFVPSQSQLSAARAAAQAETAAAEAAELPDAPALAEVAGTGLLPATAAGALTVGGTAVSGLAVGFGIGSAGVQAFYKLTGQDLADTVCVGGTGGKILGALYGQDCSADATVNIPAADQNLDATKGTVFQGTACSSTQCVSVEKQLLNVQQKYQGVPNTDPSVWCLSVAPGGTAYGTTGVSVIVNQTNGTSNALVGVLTQLSGTNTEFENQGYLVGTPCGDPSSGTVGVAIGLSATETLAGLKVGTVVTPVTATQTSGDPARDFINSVKTTDGSVYSCEGTTHVFTESDGFTVPLCTPEVPSTKVPAEVTTTEHTLDGSAPDKTVSDEQTSPAYQGTAALYPDCANGGCTMQVYTAGQPCTVGASACVDWQATPSDDTTCEYGPAGNPTEYGLAIADCAVLGGAYDPQKVAAGQAYSDPLTGASTGATTSPDQDKEQQNEAPDNTDADGQKSACWPSGWGVLNPLSWIEQPIQCAFKWAFIPKPDVIEGDVGEMNDAWQSSSVGQVVMAVQGWNLNVVPSGCDGFTWVPPGGTPGSTSKPIQIADACPGEMFQPWAAWSYGITTVLTIVFGVAGLLGLGAQLFGMRGPGED